MGWIENNRKTNFAYPIWIQITAAAIASGCFMIMFNGGWGDFLPSVITGGLGFTGLIYLHRIVKVKFFRSVSPRLSSD